MSANDDKRIKTKGSIEAYEYGTNKEITLRKEEIKSKKKKQYVKWETMTMLHEKT